MFEEILFDEFGLALFLLGLFRCYGRSWLSVFFPFGGSGGFLRRLRRSRTACPCCLDFLWSRGLRCPGLAAFASFLFDFYTQRVGQDVLHSPIGDYLTGMVASLSGPRLYLVRYILIGIGRPAVFILRCGTPGFGISVHWIVHNRSGDS